MHGPKEVSIHADSSTHQDYKPGGPMMGLRALDYVHTHSLGTHPEGILSCHKKVSMKSLLPPPSITFTHKYCTDIPACFGRPEAAPSAE